METLMAEQHGLRVELEKLNGKRKKMENHVHKMVESVKVSEREKEEMVCQLLVQAFIQKLREKRQMSKKGSTKEQELDISRSKETSIEFVAEGGCSRHVDKNEQVQGGLMEIQPEGQTFSSPDNFRGSNQEKKATTISEPFENCDFWKRMIEDDSDHENGGHEVLEEYHPKVILKVQDLMASNTLVEGENLDEKPLTKAEEQNPETENIHIM